MSDEENHHAESIFLRAQVLTDPAARTRFLTEACGDNAQLRAEVEAFLRADEKAAAFFDPRVEQAISPALGELSEGPGTTIGRYKLLEQIGEGGMGVVYMAEQQQPVHRKVALKIIKLGMDTKQVVARFEAERQALALMDHPHIAKVLDGGATDTGRPYFVMDLVRGIPITEYCDKQKLTTRERLELFIPVCQAIQHAHHKGIIHRDLKPSNVMVTLSDGTPHPMVIDFGVAKATNQKLTEQTLFTNFGQMIGTPAYMAPEQAEMSRLDVDTRSDIYSLGALLYELLTGTQPFSEVELRSVGWAEIQRIIAEKDPPKPSTRLSTLTAEQSAQLAKQHQESSHHIGVLLRGDLDWIVMKCLEKDRNRRYETANGLAADVQRHLANEPVVARPPSKLYEFQKTVRRHKVGFAAAGAVTAALVVGLMVALVAWGRQKDAWKETAEALSQETAARERAMQAEQKAEEQRTVAEEAAARSEQVAQFMKEMLEGVGPSVARGRDTELLREILDATATRLDELSDQPAVEAELCETLGVVYLEIGDPAKAETVIERSLHLRRQLHEGDHPDTARSIQNLGKVYHFQVRNLEAVAAYEEALEMQRRLFGSESLEVASSLRFLADVLRRDKAKSSSKAKAAYLEAIGIRRELLGPGDVDTARTMAALATLSTSESDMLDYTIECLREALRLQRQASDTDDPEIALTLSDLARVLALSGDRTQAEALYREALVMQRKVLGDHRDTAQTIHFLAGVVTNRSQRIELHREALKMRREVLSVRGIPTSTQVSLSCLLNALLGQGDLVEAAGVLREHVAWLHQLASEQSRSAERTAILLEAEARTLHVLGDVCMRNGTHAEARESYWQAFKTYEQMESDNLVTHLHGFYRDSHYAWLGYFLRCACLDAQTTFSSATMLSLSQALGTTDVETAPFDRIGLMRCHYVLGDKLREQGHLGESDGEITRMEQLLDELRTQQGGERQEVAAALCLLAELHIKGERWSAADELLDEATALLQNPKVKTTKAAKSLIGLVRVLMARGRQAEAERLVREVTEHTSARFLNDFAWELAIGPHLTESDGRVAVELAEEAVEATQRQNADYVDTLAAAHATAGQFVDAVRVQREAIELIPAQQVSRRDDFQMRLWLFEAGSRYRDYAPCAIRLDSGELPFP